MNTPTLRHVSPTAGFSPRIGTFVSMLDESLRRLKKYVEGLSPAQLAWHPNEKCESIGTILHHIAAVERSWIGEDILRRPMSEDEWRDAFPVRLGIPQRADRDLAFYLTILDQARAETYEVLRPLGDDDLSREIVPLDPGSPESASQTYTIEWILYHLVDHCAHHKGQIALMKRLLPPTLA